MFGDPITNPMGWEIKKLGEVCDVRDGTHDSPKYVQSSEYVLITSKNIVNGEIDFSSCNYITKEDYDSINKRSKVDVGDIIMPMIGTIGGPIIVKETSQKYGIKNVALIKFNITGVLNIYVKSLLENQSYTEYLKSLNKGGTQKFIALGTIRNLPIILPPLSLQQSFAAKVSAIEAQKQAITQSIKEVEALLAQRMDTYFS
jgi:type I restriction enzyme S subunit